MELVREASDRNADGIIIGCFDDTALIESALLADCPVLGIGQASFHYAALRNWRFSVITTLQVSVPVIKTNINAMGLSTYASRVRASEVPVLALEDDPQAAVHKITEEARAAEAEDQINALILGCAGMVHVTKALREATALAVIDPVEAAARAMLWLAR